MRSALLLARPTLLLAPLLLPFVVPLGLLPPAVAYVVSDARWLVVLGAVCAETSLVLASAGWSVERVRPRVSRLIAAAGNVKHQAALSVAYAAGLRASEVIALKVGDVDSQRMTLRVEQGKGAKDRLQAGLLPLRTCALGAVQATLP